MHSSGGYLTVDDPWRTPLAQAYVDAGVELGYKETDINGEYNNGFMKAQGTIRRGSRCSTSKAFLRPARDRRNLHIAMKAHVTRILINTSSGGNPRAYGVRYKRNGKMYKVKARKEVTTISKHLSQRPRANEVTYCR